MWLLECEGNCLAHKRLWLKPGKTYLFGRTRANNRFHVDHKSISRQHLTLSVTKVEKGDGSNVDKRSELLLRDQGSKFGTELDGVKIYGDSKTLKGDKHSVRLGNSVPLFRLKWIPIVFTFSLTSKETKASQDPLAAYRNRLEDAGLDIKLTLDYITDKTTHVVAGKRNTAKGLSAIVNGRFIVSERFLDAIVAGAPPSDLDREEELSKLEEDFDAHWPDPLKYLPDKSKEPSERPPTDFLPKPERRSVFEGYTFVFCDQVQFENLQVPITQGGGKALHCTVASEQTTSEEVIRYVKNVAGEKGLGEFEDGSEGKGVVVVKFRGKDKHAEWAARLDFEIAQALDHRLIEQSEFLDAILANDASMLRRPLLPADDDTSMQNAADQSTKVARAATKSTSNTASASATLKRKREPIKSRFKGFDDDDDEDFSLGASAPGLTTSQAANGSAVAPSQNMMTSFSDTDSMDGDVYGKQTNGTQPQNSRKRPAPPAEVEDEEDIMDKILPQHTARKRQKLALQAQGKDDCISLNDIHTTHAAAKAKKKRKPVEVNVKEVVRERREAEEAAARQDEESLRDILDGMTVDQMKNLAVVEDMELPTRQSRAQRSKSSGNSRWNDAWNGRKNFKKFRHQGEGTQQRRAQRVIVPLEEAKRKDYGIGEDYWLEKESEGSKRRRKEQERRATQSQTQQSPTQGHYIASVPSELITENGTNASETIDIDAPRTTRRQEHVQQNDSSGRTNPSQVLAEKRGAKNQMPNPALPGPRKRKKFAAARDSDGSGGEEDGVGFRLAKRMR